MPQTVLIAEDDRALADSLRRAVEGAGYVCVVAADGVATVERARADPPDLLLLDLLLPKRDGRAVLTQLQEDPATRGIPVLAMSGVFRGHAHRRELQDGGAQGFLEKPFAPRDLIAHLHAVIGPPTADSARGDRVSLAEVPMAEILWKAMAGGFSGAIQLQRGKMHKVIVLERGLPLLIRSNAASECLGRRLLRAGRIDAAALEESVNRTKADGVRQGEVLVELGVITAEEIEAELVAQSRDKLTDLFSWETGEAWQQDGVRSISFASQLEGWSPRAVVLAGVARMSPARVAACLEAQADRQACIEDGSLTPEESALPGVAEALAAVQSDGPVSDLLEAHGPALYGLWLVGALRLGDKVRDPAPSTRASATEEPAVDPAVLQELGAVRDELEGQSHFERLGVDTDAGSKQVRAAFLERAKRYHPDRHGGAPEVVRALASEIFALLSTAHEVLSDPDQRRSYQQRIASGVDEQEGRREVERILSAEQSFRAGEALFKRRAYPEALEHFDRAVELDPDEGELRAYRAWTFYLIHSNMPETADAARAGLREAVSLAPTSPTGYYFLGKLEKACGHVDEAKRMFRKVLELRPGHVDASRELRLFEMRKRGESSSGLFGFRRKRK